MNIWKIMNYAAWALSAWYMALILIDFIIVEKKRIKEDAGKNNGI